MENLTLTREQVRAVDRWAMESLGIPGLVLMENAGRNCAELLIRQLNDQTAKVVLCCGKGNNGGDGFVIARHLQIAGYSVEVLIFHHPDEFEGDARTNLTILQRLKIPCRRLHLPEDRESLQNTLQGASWIVDALLGTGSSGAPRVPYDLVITAINECGRPVLAVDLPSGLDCDTGEISTPTVRASLTATMAAFKPAFNLESSRPWTGSVCVVHLGIPPAKISEWSCQKKSSPT